MRIAVFGTGGAGGRFGAQLAGAGLDVTFIARGDHLRAIRSQGLHVETPSGDLVVRPAQASDDPAQVGVVDLILVGVKTWQLRDAAQAMRPLLGPDTVVVPLQNGVEAAAQLGAVLGPQPVLGGLCATISWVVAPGRIRSLGTTHRIRFGELDGRPSQRVQRLLAVLEGAGLQVDVPADIHRAVWEKFLFVVPFGGLGAVTRAPIGTLRAIPETRALLERGMQEIAAVGRARGVALPDEAIPKTLAVLDALPPGGTTSLQRDIEAGKPSELEAWNGAVVRLGAAAGVETPLHAFIYHSLLPAERRARGAGDPA
jgi:2-dehydropantoate 2-reductase